GLHAIDARHRAAGGAECDENGSALLRAYREWPCDRNAAHEGNELASPHSITSSAATRSVCGTVRPSALAVLRLITNSYFVGCSTGMSAGFVPRKTLSTRSAARRNSSTIFGP